MYSGVPSIRMEGNKKRGLELIPEAKQLLSKAQGVRDKAGVSTFAMTRRVDEDTTLYALATGQQNILIIAANPDVPEQVAVEPFEPEVTKFPDFYSGLVFSGYMQKRTRVVDGVEVSYTVCHSFAPTLQCQKTHKVLKLAKQDATRLAVFPHDSLEDALKNPSEFSPNVFSQYSLLRSSMYSGTMKKVVQALMGWGRVSASRFGSFAAYGSAEKDVQHQKVDRGLIDSIKGAGVQVRYDWRFTRTHGITQATDGKLWLVEISQARGVLAMPLPMIPGTDTKEFRKKVVARKDDDMLFILDELKFLPSGGSLPTSATALSAALDKGDVLRLLTAEELEPFYHASPYSSAMGWCFNTKGSQAHNTAYYFHDDGFQRGIWYRVDLSIGKMRTEEERNEDVVYGGPRKKLADGTGRLIREFEGYLFTPPNARDQSARVIPFKIYEPLVGGLLSHEGTPNTNARGKPVPKCDTPMFVSYVDDELKIIRYWRDPKSDYYTETTTDMSPGECLLNGSWTTTSVSGLRGFPPMMYTTDFDDRRVLSEDVTTTILTSVLQGYYPPFFTDYIQSPDCCKIVRERYWRNVQVTERKLGETMSSVVIVPQFSREAYYYAYVENCAGRTVDTDVSYPRVQDPNVGYGWRCFPRVNYPIIEDFGCDIRTCRGENDACAFDGTNFRGRPGVHQERKVMCLRYDEVGCGEFADSGQWLQECDTVDGFQRAKLKTGYTMHQNYDNQPTGRATLVAPGAGKVAIEVTGAAVQYQWMAPSPDPQTRVTQQLVAETNSLGEDLVVYAKNFQLEQQHSGFVPSYLVPLTGYPAIIGAYR